MDLEPISISLNNITENLSLIIKPKSIDSLFIVKDAREYGEASYQLKEGHFYHYQLSSKDYYFEKDEIIDPSPFNKNEGSISPNIYVGTLSLDLYKVGDQNPVGTVDLEVRSIKTSYREDYRYMLESITDKCTDLILQVNSPVSQQFETDFYKDSETIYQRFAFVQSIINSDEFNEAVHRIVNSPKTMWTEESDLLDIRGIKRISNSDLKQILNSNSRTKLPINHPLRKIGIETIPTKIDSIRKIDTVDTPENRFVKHALDVFLKFCIDIESSVTKGSRIHKEVSTVIKNLETNLHHSLFKKIARPTSLNLNSPVLQRREGYREVLKVWLMFDLAAKLVWHGGDDVYKGGKRDISALYEYWLFFALLDLLKEIFEIEPKDIEDLIKPTQDKLGLQLIQGKHTAIKGTSEIGNRKLNIQFNFNRTFAGGNTYPAMGSWTKPMRPDYTLSIWPAGISENDAEKQELIVHIHFDAKYKIENLIQIIDQDANLDTENIEYSKGKYKNVDLLKMHAYKDAIRRTGGAYVLYPGDKSYVTRGFHEIIPGLGAFPIRPSRDDTGISELKAFILDIIHHFLNRASQRENLSYHVFDIHKSHESNELTEAIPESYGENRDLIPDETYVLVGFYNSVDHLVFFKKTGLYNFRMDSDKGSLILDKETVSAKYLLLHTHGENFSGELWKIKSKGPKVFSKENLISQGYPSIPSQENYLVIEIEPIDKIEFNYAEWEFKNLKYYSSYWSSAIPFTATLTELMGVKIK